MGEQNWSHTTSLRVTLYLIGILLATLERSCGGRFVIDLLGKLPHWSSLAFGKHGSTTSLVLSPWCIS